MDFIYSIFPNIDRFFLLFIPAVVGIILHEVAHGYAAYLLGDPTAKALGRLTLNPLKHIDPMGTMVFILTALASPLVFGWAKPVPIQPRFFKHPRQGMMLVSFAGPLANFCVAFVCALILLGLYHHFELPRAAWPPLYQNIAEGVQAGIFINCVLAWFNLMPIPPLDGSHILGGLLPAPLARQYASIGRYGMLILIGLLYFRLLDPVLRPLLDMSVRTIVDLAGFFF